VAATNILLHSVCFRLHFVKEKKEFVLLLLLLLFLLFLSYRKNSFYTSCSVVSVIMFLHLGWRFFDEFLFARHLEASFVRSANDILTCDLALGGDLGGSGWECDTYYSSDLYG
jgi:hypothetical protein